MSLLLTNVGGNAADGPADELLWTAGAGNSFLWSTGAANPLKWQ